MTTIKLTGMESLAVSGIAWRFQTEIDDACARRNKDIERVLAEHSVHVLPKSYSLRVDKTGYVTSIEWDEADNAEECEHED